MKKPKKTIVHVNQAIVKKNKKEGTLEPVLTVKTYNTNEYAFQAIIRDPEGNEVARVIYNPLKPLSCGARVWIAVDGDKGSVELIKEPPSSISCPSSDASCSSSS